MNAAPAVVVRGLPQARAALALGLPVTLLSAPGAALFAGCGWWRALIRTARAEYPATPAADILDCADAAGWALEALRIGQLALVLAAETPARDAVSRIAAQYGARLLADRPAALDPDLATEAPLLRAWLRGDSGPGLG